MTEELHSSRKGIDWSRVLGLIEQTLARSLALTGETGPAPLLSVGDRLDLKGPLQQIDDRLEQWRKRLVESQANAEAADEGLAGEIQSLEHWLKAAAASRQTLVAWAEREK